MARPRRLFAATLPLTAASLTLDETARAHAHVLRLDVGEQVCLFDARGGSALARIARCDRKQLVCEVEPAQFAAPRALRLSLVVCVPKAAKLDLIVRMATELGVHALLLADSERAVSKLASDSGKLERLRRIALEACAQSEQAWAPELHGPLPLSAAAALAPAAADKLVFWEDSGTGLVLPPPAAAERDVWAVVGPEGGLSEHEVHVLTQQGYEKAGFGSAILRVETACVAASVLLLDRMQARS